MGLARGFSRSTFQKAVLGPFPENEDTSGLRTAKQASLLCTSQKACKEGIFLKGKLRLWEVRLPQAPQSGIFRTNPEGECLQLLVAKAVVGLPSFWALGLLTCPQAAFGCYPGASLPLCLPPTHRMWPRQGLPTALELRKLSRLPRPECCAQLGCIASGPHVSSPHRCSSPSPL